MYPSRHVVHAYVGSPCGPPRLELAHMPAYRTHVDSVFKLGIHLKIEPYDACSLLNWDQRSTSNLTSLLLSLERYLVLWYQLYHHYCTLIPFLCRKLSFYVFSKGRVHCLPSWVWCFSKTPLWQIDCTDYYDTFHHPWYVLFQFFLDTTDNSTVSRSSSRSYSMIVSQ